MLIYIPYRELAIQGFYTRFGHRVLSIGGQDTRSYPVQSRTPGGARGGEGGGTVIYSPCTELGPWDLYVYIHIERWTPRYHIYPYIRSRTSRGRTPKREPDTGGYMHPYIELVPRTFIRPPTDADTPELHVEPPYTERDTQGYADPYTLPGSSS